MIIYRPCTDRDLPALKALWLSCFEEREDAAELFFQQNHATYHAYACEADGALVSAVYLIDCTLGGDKAHYLCGAATTLEYRGRGIMSALIDCALEDAARRGDRYSALFPASKSLYDFYARRGYLPACAVKRARLSTDTGRACFGGAPDLQAFQAACGIENALIWTDDFIRFAADYYGCYGAETAQSANAYAIYEEKDKCAEVYYAVYTDIESLNALLRAKGIEDYFLMGAVDSPLFEGGVTKPYGMIRPLSGDAVPEDVYIGITLQ